MKLLSQAVCLHSRHMPASYRFTDSCRCRKKMEIGQQCVVSDSEWVFLVSRLMFCLASHMVFVYENVRMHYKP